MLEAYDNLYWTRLVAIEDFEAGRDRKHGLGRDIIDELQALELVEPDEESESWEALFDPSTFSTANQPLTLDRFRLPEAELKSWAERVVRIRADIEVRVKEIAVLEQDVDRHDENLPAVPTTRSRKG